jgi:hypothetical protein
MRARGSNGGLARSIRPAGSPACLLTPSRCSDKIASHQPARTDAIAGAVGCRLVVELVRQSVPDTQPPGIRGLHRFRAVIVGPATDRSRPRRNRWIADAAFF